MRITPALFAMFLVPLFALPSRESHPQSSSTHWDTLVEKFIEGYFAFHPEDAIDAGRHEFDGKLPDWSSEGLRREVTWLHVQRRTAEGFDTISLEPRQRFERDYLLAIIDRNLFWLESAEWPFKNPQFYQYALDPSVYLSREYAPLPDRMLAYITYLRAIPSAINEIRKNIRSPLPKPYIERGISIFRSLASYYENDVPSIFGSVEDLHLQRELRTQNEKAIKAMKELEAWLVDSRDGATGVFGLGEDLFLEMLRATEGVEISLQELEEIGRRDLERNLTSLREACRNYAPDKTINACIEMAQAKKPEVGPVEAARRQLNALKRFILDKDLVSIPGTEEARVEEAPPYMRWNFAYINIPGPFEKGIPSTYYIAPPDPMWSKEEQEAYIPGEADLLFTSIHEVWPGHFLQYLHSNRAQSKLGQLFVGYAFSEGWAHYTEELMWEAGVGNVDPEAHIGQLLNALLRNVRFLSAIGLHTGTMTIEESERMFRDQAYQDPGNARQQAARGTFDPAYLNYTLGKLMIQKLREDWTSSRGGRKAWREFHDKFLSYGGPPIPLIRKLMLGSETGSLF